MMRQYVATLIILVLGMVGMQIRQIHAQEPDSPPLVVFIEDQRLRTASILDDGPDGLTKLEAIFQSFGAQTEWRQLDEPLPENARVVVLVRPLAALPVQYVARLWVHMMRGNHLLLAMDPIGVTTYRGEGNIRSNPDRARAGLSTLLATVYGIGLQDTFMVEPWFATSSIVDNTTTHMVSYGENIAQHPVSEPLAAYDLPIQMWGARSMTVDPFGLHSYAVTLLYTESAYGETDQGVFNGKAALEANIGVDSMGHLFTAALAENTLTGSRVVLLGDSELLENEFGLATWPGTNSPLHLGNRLFTERLVAWLLNRPTEEWPLLPIDYYTWLALDGEGSDWTSIPEIAQDPAGDSLSPQFDIVHVYAFRDDNFLYVRTDLADLTNPDVRLSLAVENTSDGVIDMTFVMTEKDILLLENDGQTTPIPDGAMVVGEVIEVRLPLRVVGEGALLGELCLADSRTEISSPPLDCAIKEIPALVPVVNTEAPVDVVFPGPRAIVSTFEAAVNVRAAPSGDSDVVDIVSNSKVLAVTGRTALGDWIQVQTATYSGWISAPLVKVNTDIGDLPVVTGQ